MRSLSKWIILLTSFVCLSSCNEESPQIIDNNFTLFPENGYAYLTKENGRTYFAFMANVNEAAISYQDVKLGDRDKPFMNACKMEEGNHFITFYFDLTSYFAGQQSSYESFYPHLYLNNNLWDGYQNGDLLSSKDGQQFIPSWTYISEEDHQYYLRSYEDSYPMCAIYSYKDIELSLDDDNNYVTISYEDEHFYYNISGTYISSTELNKKSLKITDGDKGSYECEKLILSSKTGYTHFTASFNVDGMLDKMNVNDNDRQYSLFTPHLYFNGEAFDNYLGYVDNGHMPSSSSATYGNTMFRIDTPENTTRTNILASQVLKIYSRDFDSLTTEQYTNEYPISLNLLDDNVVLSLSGYFSGTFGNYSISKEVLKIKDFIDEEAVEIHCSLINISKPNAGSGSRFIADFNITNLTTNADHNFWCHLIFNNEVFDGNNGDFKPGSYQNDANWTLHQSVVYDGKTYSLYSCYGMVVLEII